MNRSVLIAGGIVAVILVLAGAAFVGAQMLSQPQGAEAQAEAGNTARVMEVINDDGSGPKSLRMKVVPNPELPDREAEVQGVFSRREDNSIFVGTGNIMLDVEVNGDTGEQQVSLSSDGPDVEVVVTRDTVIYEETTNLDPSEQKIENGEVTIQQEIEPVDSLEVIENNTEFMVWGEKRGDRLVAEVLVFRMVEGF